jgi:hypothetical protein
MEFDTWMRVLFALALPFLLIRMGLDLWRGRLTIAGEVYRRDEQPRRYWGQMASAAFFLVPIAIIVAVPRHARPPVVSLSFIVAILVQWFVSRDDWKGGRAPSQRRGEWVTLAIALGTMALALGALVLVTAGVL